MRFELTIVQVPPAIQLYAEILALNKALESLAKLDNRKARVVELRYFGGLSVEETAEVLGINVGSR